MDPVSALGLASSIYTFVEVGFKVARQYKDFRQNRSIETRENTERRLLATELKTISAELTENNGPPLLKGLGDECNGLCSELLSLLDNVTVKDSASRRQRLKAIVKERWRAPDISSLENRLNNLRTQLVVNLVNTIKENQVQFFDRLDQLSLQLRQLAELRSDLDPVLQMYHDGSDPKTDDRLGPLLLRHRDMMANFFSYGEILSRLQFSGMDDREYAIHNPTEGTLTTEGEPDDQTRYTTEAWTMEGEADGQTQYMMEDRLFPWLRDGRGVFHISGKAGSGKSTLMKHISTHARTRHHLEEWAGQRKLVYAAFYFWVAGNSEQKSLLGLYRSILHEVLSHDTSLIRVLFPQCWPNGRFAPGSAHGIGQPRNIEAAFHSLLRQTSRDQYRVCLFIDGLDEYEATGATDREAYWKLAKQLGSWADESKGNVKLCVSSRPYTEFLVTFNPSWHADREQIHLHELNQRDIETHCRVVLRAAQEDFPDISRPLDQASCEDVAWQISDRAEGVFLWAFLVLRIILNEARRGGSHEDVQQKLDETPTDMDKLYDKMFRSLNGAEKEASIRLCAAVLSNPFDDGISVLCLRRLINRSLGKPRVPDDYTFEDAFSDAGYVLRHLDVWSHGMIEAPGSDVLLNRPPRPSSSSSYLPGPMITCATLLKVRVKFLHRTARDYLLCRCISELESTIEEFISQGSHTDLRLTELAMMARFDSNYYRLADRSHYYHFAFKLFGLKTYTALSLAGKQMHGFQLPWASVVELVNYISPSLYRLSPYDYRFLLREVHRDDSETKLSDRVCLAPFFGVMDDEILRILKQKRYEDERGVILLGAIHSSLLFGDLPLLGKLSCSALIDALVAKGFSGRDRLRTKYTIKYPLRCYREPRTVWLALVYAIPGLSQHVPYDKFIRYVGNLGELLRNEPQAEVLFLGCVGPDYYDPLRRNEFFITLEDYLLSRGTPAGLLDQLQDWPRYDENAGAPPWVADTLRAEGRDWGMMTCCKSVPDEGELSVAISRTEMLPYKELIDYGFEIPVKLSFPKE
ncbi:hypothetical protein GGS20DRAFT_537131 [Poronia punctata]|nr:hypothetical protein GGS20DRAFT_537131 [Poronia punctata]